MTTGQNYVGGESHATQIEDSASVHTQVVENATQSAEPSQTSTTEQPATVDTGQHFTTDIAPGPDGKPIAAALPVFITRHFQSVEKYTLLQQALKKVFRQFYLSDEYVKPGEPIERSLAYKALEMCLERVFRWEAQKTLGTLPEEPLEVPGDIDENVFQPEAYEVTTLNPYNVSNVEELQKWVETLQSMSHLSANAVKSMRKSILLSEGIIDTQKKQIETATRLNEGQRNIIDALTARVDRLTTKRHESTEQKEPEPNQSSHIELPVFIGDGDESEIEIVRRALAAAAKIKFDEILASVCNGETEEAFYYKEEYDSLQDILERLAVYVAILSGDNHDSLIYHQDNRQYERTKRRRRNEQMTRKAAFIKAYSTMESDDEEGEEAESEPAQEPELLPIPDPEPPYLVGLDAPAKQVMLYNATHGLSAEQLMKMRSFLYPESQEKPLPWEAPTDQSATTQE